MPIRYRKLIGGVIIIVSVVIYALLAMTVAQARFIQEASGPLQAIFYAILGLGWMFPIMPLIKWMEGGGKPSP